MLVSYGAMLDETIQAARLLEADGIKADVINARFAKPIDPKLIALAQSGKNTNHHRRPQYHLRLRLRSTRGNLSSIQNPKSKIQNLGSSRPLHHAGYTTKPICRIRYQRRKNRRNGPHDNTSITVIDSCHPVYISVNQSHFRWSSVVASGRQKNVSGRSKYVSGWQRSAGFSHGFHCKWCQNKDLKKILITD